MATRSKMTFQKRQKEMKRIDKQKMKAEKRAQKKLAKDAGGTSTEEVFEVMTGPAEIDPLN